jgi:hypothetical protein
MGTRPGRVAFAKLICPGRPLDGLKLDRKDAMTYLDNDLLKATDIANGHVGKSGDEFELSAESLDVALQGRHPQVDLPLDP